MKTLKIGIIITLLLISSGLFAQEPPPPPPPGDHGLEGNQGPSDAPIDGGLGILLALGAGYGGYKVNLMKRKEKQNEEERKSEN